MPCGQIVCLHVVHSWNKLRQNDKDPNIAHNNKVIFESSFYSKKKPKFCQQPMFYYLLVSRGSCVSVRRVYSTNGRCKTGLHDLFWSQPLCIDQRYFWQFTFYSLSQFRRTNCPNCILQAVLSFSDQGTTFIHCKFILIPLTPCRSTYYWLPINTTYYSLFDCQFYRQLRNRQLQNVNIIRYEEFLHCLPWSRDAVLHFGLYSTIRP